MKIIVKYLKKSRWWIFDKKCYFTHFGKLFIISTDKKTFYAKMMLIGQGNGFYLSQKSHSIVFKKLFICWINSLRRFSDYMFCLIRTYDTNLPQLFFPLKWCEMLNPFTFLTPFETLLWALMTGKVRVLAILWFFSTWD